MAHTFKPSTQKAETVVFLYSRPAHLHSELQASQGYTAGPFYPPETNTQTKSQFRILGSSL